MKESSLLSAERVSYIDQQFWLHHMLHSTKKSLYIPDEFASLVAVSAAWMQTTGNEAIAMVKQVLCVDCPHLRRNLLVTVTPYMLQA